MVHYRRIRDEIRAFVNTLQHEILIKTFANPDTLHGWPFLMFLLLWPIIQGLIVAMQSSLSPFGIYRSLYPLYVAIIATFFR